jgi:predicted PurR-regulated permease PerM
MIIPPAPETITPGILRRLMRQQVYVATLIGIVIWFAYSVREVLPIFLFSFILAYLLHPLVRWVSGPEGKGVSRKTAALIVYLLVILALGVAIYILYGALSAEISNYAKNLDIYKGDLLINLYQQEYHGLLRPLPQSVKLAIINGIANANNLSGEFARRTLPELVKTAPRLVEGIAVPIVAYYLLTDYRRFIGFFRKAVRPEGRGRFDELIHEISNSLRGYLSGQVTLSVIAGVAAFVILTVNGVRPALVVGIAAIFLELIPVVGPLVWVIMAILLTAIQRPEHTIIVAALAIVAHQTDMHILAPRILGSHLRLHPAVVIFALLAGNALMGILGVLLAAPLAAIINITLIYLLTEGALSPTAVGQSDDIPLPPAAPGPPVQGETDTPREQVTPAPIAPVTPRRA